MIIRIIIEAIVITSILIGFFALGMLLGNGTITIYSFSLGDNNSTNEVNLTFGSDMNETEIEDAKSLVNSLDPKYLALVKSIFFGKNRSEMNLDNKLCYKAYGTGCGGFNENGKITLAWKGIRRTKYVLCHELLHDFIPIKTNKASKKENGRWL